MVTIAAAFFSISVAAHNNKGDDPGNYCAKNKDGKTIVMHNGSELTKTIKLEDGTKVKRNGTIVFTNGKRVKLVEGECVDENNLGHFSDREDRMNTNKERRKAKREERRQKREYSDVEYK